MMIWPSRPGTIKTIPPPGRTSRAMLRSAATWSSMCSSTL
jgi:hypothetical protein